MHEPVYLEIGRRWSYAVAVEWPGWCRHAKGADDPLAALLDCGPRYQRALAAAGIAFDPPAGPDDVEVVAVHEGNRGTEWGVPSVVPDQDSRPLDEPEADRLAAILQASWRAFDSAVEDAQGMELRKGPRGGGRDLDALVRHCVESDLAYLARLGARKPPLKGDDPGSLEAAIRERALEAFRDRAAGLPVREPNRVSSLWLPRFYVRYVAWHALVHAWEIEDRRVDPG